MMGFVIFFQFECFDWDKDTEHDLIGSFDTTLRDLAAGKEREVRMNIKLNIKYSVHPKSVLLNGAKTICNVNCEVFGSCAVKAEITADYEKLSNCPNRESNHRISRCRMRAWSRYMQGSICTYAIVYLSILLKTNYPIRYVCSNYPVTRKTFSFVVKRKKKRFCFYNQKSWVQLSL